MLRALTSALLLLTLAACGDRVGSSPSSPSARHTGPIELAVVPKSVGSEFFEQVRIGAECAASHEKDVRIRWEGTAAETDAAGQVRLLQRFLDQGVDGLVYAATDARTLAQVTEQARRLGRTVVNIDSGTYPQPGGVPLFATDNVTAATAAADLLAESVGAGPKKIAILKFLTGSETGDERLRGFKSGLSKHPNLELVAEQSTESDFLTAVSVASSILAANPDLAGIFAANEPSARGAAEAVRRAGRSGQIKIVGWDTAAEQLRDLRSGVVSALVAQNPFRMGYEGVRAAVRMLREGSAVPSADTGVAFITAANLDSPEIQALLNPSCANPPGG